ncbi:MAG: SH3 domain-containing protein [Kiritimatiellae bacterium]|nr:SH3 domain-containing protein [Kiritimatiellia bacterium]
MKRFVGIALAALICAPLVWAAAHKAMSVQVRNGQLRSGPSYLSKPAGAADYAERVEILATQGAWHQVRTPSGHTGWLHQSALTARALNMTAAAGEVRVGASASEVALAAKGFTEQVEREYKSRNPEVDFTWVDRMERLAISPERAAEFLQQGQVKPPTGDRP